MARRRRVECIWAFSLKLERHSGSPSASRAASTSSHVSSSITRTTVYPSRRRRVSSCAQSGDVNNSNSSQHNITTHPHRLAVVGRCLSLMLSRGAGAHVPLALVAAISSDRRGSSRQRGHTVTQRSRKRIVPLLGRPVMRARERGAFTSRHRSLPLYVQNAQMAVLCVLISTPAHTAHVPTTSSDSPHDEPHIATTFGTAGRAGPPLWRPVLPTQAALRPY